MQSEMPLKRGPETLAWQMTSQIQQEIVFITGKGGVGKSAVAAGFALNRALMGKKTLLVELGYQSFFKDYFDLPDVTYRPKPLRENLDLALWSGPECLKEYALHLIKVESLYRLFFENAVTRSLINVAPALSELAMLGKITSHPRQIGPPLLYDVIVVDAFSTGHFLALLKAPEGMSEAIRFGPMGQQSRSIERILKNPQYCKYFVVSLPEELPVVEGMELAAEIEKLVGIKPRHVLNKIVPLTKASLSEKPMTDKLEKFQDYLQKINLQQDLLEKKLSDQFPTWKVPFVFSSQPWEIVDSIAKTLSDSQKASK